MRRSLMLVLALFILPVPLLAQERGVTPEDYYRLVAVGDVALAPSGNLLAFTVTTVQEEENRRHSEIWMQRLRDGRPDGEPYRFTDPTRSASAPRWSPDGELLAFRSRRGDDGDDIWFVRIREAGGEAFRVEGVNALPVWSPDAQWLAFTAAPEGDAGAGRDASLSREGWIAPDAVTRTSDPDRFDGRVITRMRYKRDGTHTLLPHGPTRVKDQLMLVAAEGGSARQLTDLRFQIRSVAWSRDGNILYFAGDPHEDDEYSADPSGSIYSIGREGGEPRLLTPGPGAYIAPAPSPDGRQLAFLWTPERGAATQLLIAELAQGGGFAGEPRRMAAGWELGFRDLDWTPDGRHLRFETQVGGDAHLFEVPAAGGDVRQVTTGERRLTSFSWSQDGRLMAYTATDAVTPSEVFVAGADGDSELRVTSFNDAWLADVNVVRPARLTWTVEDGTEIEGWLVRPVGYEPGGSYPLVLKIHGGPHTAYGNTFFQAFHVLSAAGFFVLYTNPRGSSAYGHEFMYATRGRWGELDQEDLLTGLDLVLERYPEIDERRLGVSGGSYGGFMTNWLTARTDRFAAAVTSRSITNWESWYGTSDVPGLTEFEFLGAPWEQRELYRRLSPISYVEHVTAPTLIIHSEQDHRTPIADAEQWFVALKKRQVPVEFVRYPRSSHGLSRTGEPWLLVDRLERIRSWFEHWLSEAPPTAEE